jgi:hypothetical protein
MLSWWVTLLAKNGHLHPVQAAFIKHDAATVNSLNGAVSKAAQSVRDAVIALAVADRRSPLFGVPVDQVDVGVTAGMGFALMEHAVFDRRTARVVNAVYHATGRRIRSLPITQDKLL